MSEYFPRIAKVIGSLPNSTRSSRRAVYERARIALIDQMRAQHPPASNEYIDGELTELAVAIEVVEAHIVDGLHVLLAAEVTYEINKKIFALAPNRPALRAKIYEDGRKRLSNELLTFSKLTTYDPALASKANAELNKEIEDIERDFISRHILSIRKELSEVVSPRPMINKDGKLDVGRNSVFDIPLPHTDLEDMPFRQRAIIGSILAGLPKNAPAYLRPCLSSYDKELQSRGAAPIVGVLEDMATIVSADLQLSSSDEDWLAPGLRRALELFVSNNDLLLSHFPKKVERDAVFLETNVIQEELVGATLSMPFKQVADAAEKVRDAGLATDDFFETANQYARLADVEAHRPIEKTQSSNPNESQKVSARKRIFLAGLGFLERLYNLLGTTVTLTTSLLPVQFTSTLKHAIDALAKLIIP